MSLVSAGFINTTDIDTTATQKNIISTSTEIISTSTTVVKKENVQSKVKVYFSDAPIMHKIAFCESRNRQFDKNGSVMRGVVNSKDVGILQINERYHLSDSKKMGINIYTIDGNLEYARHLYENQGTQPWSSSRPCWGNAVKIAYNR